jgi:LmbE family N-acetylglucosaminyl deacetylase
MTRRQTLLGIFAHPDDESFGPGGTFARYAAEGKQTHIIIATDGIAGSIGDASAVNGHATLAQARAGELSNAAVALGVTTIWSLPYRDSGMRNTLENNHPEALIQQPLEQIIQEILGYIERLHPDVIVTHDPFGGYGHPDHIRVCEATTAVFHLGRRQQSEARSYRGPQKLYYTAFDKRILKIMVRLMPLMGQDPTALGRNKDIDLAEISRWHTPVHTQIDVEAYLRHKETASRAHASQYSGGPSYIRILPHFMRRRFLRTESFTRAFPAPTGGVERDLFAGVV